MRSVGLIVLVLASGCGENKRQEPAPKPEPKVVVADAAIVVDAVEPAATVIEEPSPEAIHKLHAEPIAGLSLGMTTAEVVKVLGKPTKQTKVAPIGNAKDEIGMTWTWPTLTANFGSAPKNGTLTLREVTFNAASKVKTSRGVGIGSTRAEILAAYPGLADPIFVKDKRLLVLGNANGALNGLEFSFREQYEEQQGDLEHDRVKAIEWAGGAEN